MADMEITGRNKSSSQLLVAAAMVLSGVTVAYSIVFSYQFASNALIGTLLAIMMVGFNVLEFTLITFISGFVRERLLAAVFFAALIIVSGISFSVFSNIWVVSDSYSSGMNDRRVAADSYQGWVVAKDTLAKQIRELDEANISQSEELDTINRIEGEINQILGQRALNSNNANTGQTVGQITSNCTTINYYYKKYCSAIEQHKTAIENSRQRAALAAKKEGLEKRLAELSASPPANSDIHAPGVKSLSLLIGVPEEKVIAFVNFWLALLSEIGAIFGWFVVGRVSQHVTYQDYSAPINSVNTANVVSHAPVNSLINFEGDIMGKSQKNSDDAKATRELLSANLKAVISTLGMTSASLAQGLQIPPATFAEYVSGKRTPPITAIIKLNEFLHGKLDINAFLTKPYSCG